MESAKELNARASELFDQGHFEEALPVLERSLAIFEESLGPDHPNTGICLSNLAQLHQAMDSHDRALPLFERSLTILEAYFGADHPNTALSLNNLALLHRAMGSYHRALPLAERALSIREQSLGADHPDTANSLATVALLHWDMGSYDRAIPLNERALQITEISLGPGDLQTASILNNLALLHKDMGSYERAGALFQRALWIRESSLGPDHPDTAQSLSNLAQLYKETGSYDGALPLYERALAIREQSTGPDHPDTANTLNNLAELHVAMGSYDLALPLHERALAIFEQSLGTDHPDTASSLNNLAGLHAATGSYDRALPLLKRVLAIREHSLGPDHPETAITLGNLAGIYREMGLVDQALPLLERELVILNDNLTRHLSVGSEAAKLAYLNALSGTTHSNISFHLRECPGEERAAHVAFDAVLHRKGRALEAQADTWHAVRAAMDPDGLTLLDALRSLRSRQSALVKRGPAAMPRVDYRDTLDELDDRAGELERKLADRSALYRAEIRPATVEAVQAALPSGAALVEIVAWHPHLPGPQNARNPWGEPQYAAYILPASGALAWVDLGEASPIETEVLAFRRALATGAEHPKQARSLYERLWAPIEPLLGDARQVLLSPDGTLNLLPFDALEAPDGGILLERVDITYLGSGRDLLRMDAHLGARNGPMIVADPDYEMTGVAAAIPDDLTSGAKLPFAGHRPPDLRGRHWERLPGAATEAEELAALLPGAIPFTGPAATERAILAADGPRILHVATHGFFLDDQAVGLAGRGAVPAYSAPDPPRSAPLIENPLLRSGLVLAGANSGGETTEGDDGYLTAAELATADLVGTSLVVLSACDTGVGEVSRGQGVHGLRRALVLAGSESQVLSLWKVSDDVTRDLMIAYYERLLAGEGRSAALRAARLELFRDERTRAPFYWAAFIPSGDWRPLPAEGEDALRDARHGTGGEEE